MDKSNIITEILKSKAILVGTPTIGKEILSCVAEIMEIIKGLRSKIKKLQHLVAMVGQEKVLIN